ncbi:phospholipid-binding protein MlaC [Gluconacetobacter sacchari]|uniref:ABC transporter substrate-binding protein n=2 Tax=Gluconacetobacter sacchari TaxID=92759 RepID=A0A7W4IAQ4_9PROT|nr:ABC transporter substrate-binding protein [Gluconacetobacter sacchari]MBB2159411.1 ABC transporter substrate-binding protein [Gluconacetobacter sacchari]GBQ28750.1 toluene transporter auxiliary component Ttg2D [Gluconacetobacter sacchari DSM 12717]
MKTALSRRHTLGLAFAAAMLWGTAAARATPADDARAFINTFGQQMVAIVNSNRSLSEKKSAFQPLLENNVDIDSIGRTCLGRYWRVATPEQRTRFLSLFHQVVVNSITDQIGDYRGVTFTIGRVTPSGTDQAVDTVINRPEQPAVNAQWIVSFGSGRPMVMDVVAEGPRLSVTTQQDYASFLSQHNGSIDALLHALERKVAAHNAPAQAH